MTDQSVLTVRFSIILRTTLKRKLRAFDTMSGQTLATFLYHLERIIIISNYWIQLSYHYDIKEFCR